MCCCCYVTPNDLSYLPYVVMVLCLRMWTLPEASEIARPNANVEEGTVPIAAECGSKKVGCFFLPLPIPPRIPKANPQFDPCLPVGAIKSSPFWSIQCHA